MTEIVNSGSPGQTFIDLWLPDPVSIYGPSLSPSVSRLSLFQTHLRWVISSPGKGRSQSPPLVLPCRWVPGLRPSGQTKARSSEKYLTVYSDCRDQSKFWKFLGPLIPPPSKKRKVKDNAGFRATMLCLEDELTCVISIDTSLNPLADLLDLVFGKNGAQNTSEAISALYRLSVLLITKRKLNANGDENLVVGIAHSWVFCSEGWTRNLFFGSNRDTSSSLPPSQTDTESSPPSLMPRRPKSILPS